MISDHSHFATKLDHYNLLLTGVCVVVALAIIGFTIYYCVVYGEKNSVPRETKGDSLKLEITWTSITLAIFILFFWQGSSLYREQVTPKKADYKIFVFGKRWMWKFHHENGFVEAGELHLPKNKTIEFVMTSQDVIHSFYIPEFRIKQDLLPGVFTRTFARPLKDSSLSLLCAEYCGTAHAKMIAPVRVVSESDYRKKTQMHMPLLSRGKRLFKERGCFECHSDQRKAPELVNLTDDSFIRDSILSPGKVIRTGFDNSMPSYNGELSEEDIRDLIQYIKEFRS